MAVVYVVRAFFLFKTSKFCLRFS